MTVLFVGNTRLLFSSDIPIMFSYFGCKIVYEIYILNGVNTSWSKMLEQHCVFYKCVTCIENMEYWYYKGCMKKMWPPLPRSFVYLTYQVVCKYRLEFNKDWSVLAITLNLKLIKNLLHHCQRSSVFIK